MEYNELLLRKMEDLLVSCAYFSTYLLFPCQQYVIIIMVLLIIVASCDCIGTRKNRKSCQHSCVWDKDYKGKQLLPPGFSTKTACEANCVIRNEKSRDTSKLLSPIWRNCWVAKLRKCSVRMLIHITNGLPCNLLNEINFQLVIRQLQIHPTSEMLLQIPFCDTLILLIELMKLQNWITVKYVGNCEYPGATICFQICWNYFEVGGQPLPQC